MTVSPQKNQASVIGIALIARLAVGCIASLPLGMPQLLQRPLLWELVYTAAMAAAPLAAVFLLRGDTPLPLYARRREMAGSLPLFCGQFCAQVLLTLACAAAALHITGSSESEAVPQGAAFWVWLAARVLLAPVLEEYLFRGCVLSRLLPFGDGGALLLSSLLFALSHGSIFQLLPAFASGIFLGLAALRHGLAVSTLFHICNNALAAALLLLQQTAYATAAQAVCIASALICGCFALLRRDSMPRICVQGVRLESYMSAPLAAAMALMLFFMF